MRGRALLVLVIALARVAGAGVVLEPVAEPFQLVRGLEENAIAGIAAGEAVLINVPPAALEEVLSKTPGVTPVLLLYTHFATQFVLEGAALPPGAKVVAQTNLLPRLKLPRTQPAQVFGDALDIPFQGSTLRLVHLPNGNSPGDAVLYVREANLAVLGRHFYAGRFPILDVQHANIYGYLENIQVLARQFPDDLTLVPAVGPLAARADLEAYATMIEDSQDLLLQRTPGPTPRAEVMAQSLPESIARWAWEKVSEADWIGSLYTTYYKK